MTNNRIEEILGCSCGKPMGYNRKHIPIPESKLLSALWNQIHFYSAFG